MLYASELEAVTSPSATNFIIRTTHSVIPTSVLTRLDTPVPWQQAHSHQHQTAAQLIAQVTSNSVAIDAPPAVMSPAPIDQGPDVSEIIAAAEQLDLEQAARQPGLPHEDLFGRVILLCLLVTNVLTLLVAAFSGM